MESNKQKTQLEVTVPVTAEETKPGAGGSKRPQVNVGPVVRLARCDVAGTSSGQNSREGSVTRSRADSFVLELLDADGDTTPMPSETDSDTSVMSILSNGGKRKRGRPPTTGDYVGLADAKRKALDLLRQEELLRTEEEGMDPSRPVGSPCRSSLPLPADEDLVAEMREQPTADLGACVLAEMDVVRRIAGASKRLKGGFVRLLRIAAKRTEKAVCELQQRTVAGTNTERLEKENQALRGKVEDLEAQLQKLTGEVKALQVRADRMPPPTSAPTRTTARSGAGTDGASLHADADVTEVAMEEEPTAPDNLTPAGGRARGAVCEEAPARRTPGRETPELLAQLVGLLDGKLGAFRRELLAEVRRESGRAADPKKSKEKDGARPAEVRQPAASGVAATGGKAPKKKKKSPVAKATEPAREKGNGPGMKPAKCSAAAPQADRPMGTETVPSGGNPDVPWSQVVGRRARKDQRGGPPAPSGAVPSTAREASPGRKEKGGQKPRVRPPRVPGTAAVTVTVPEGSPTTIGEAMAKARAGIQLEDLGIEGGLKVRRAITGALVLEVPGPESAEKALKLEEGLRTLFAEGEVRVARPVKTAELRVRGLEDSVVPAEVAEAVARAGGCTRGDVKVGDIRPSPNGLGTAWVRCPASAAKKLAVEGKIRVGWASAKVEVLAARPLQCFRCLELGHVRQRCTNPVDRSTMCYVCGAAGHRASKCEAPPNCPLCADLGRPASHRLGSRGCAPRPPKGRQGTQAAPSNKGGAKTPASAAPPAEGRERLEEAMES